jgi:subtilisin family serine protease
MRRLRRGTAVLAGLMLASTAGTAWAQGGGGDTGVYQQEWPMFKFSIQQIRQQLQAHGANVVVAVVDTGIDANQPDLTGSLVPGADFSQGQPESSPGNDTGELSSSEAHGTAMSSIIAAHGHNENGRLAGMIGLADQAKIMPVRIGNGEASSDTDQNIANGVTWAVAHGAQVINLSLGSASESIELQTAINQAISKNVIVVASAGNSGTSGNPVNYPAAQSGVVAVSGYEEGDTFWPDSESGSYIAISGPAKDVMTAGTDGYYLADGTSDAAAYISAEAALLIAAHPSWTAGQVIRVMLGTASAGPGQTQGQRNDQFGYGIMNPYAALQAAEPSDTSNPLLAPTNTQPATNPPTSAPTRNGAASGGSQPSVPPAATSGNGKTSNTGVIIGAAAGGVVLLAIIITWIAVSSSRRRRNMMPAGPTGLGPPPGSGPGMPPYQGPGQPPPGGGYLGGPYPPNGQPPQPPTSYPPGRR